MMNGFGSLLAEMLAYFRDAELRVTDSRQRRMTLCNMQICIVYSSAMLENHLFKAFEHLETIGSTPEPEFRIFICDRNILGRDLPGWTALEDHQERKTLIYNAGSTHALFNPDSRIFCLVDTASRRGWYYLPQAADLPFYEKAAPMRMILHWCCETTGMVMVHAAAIGWSSRAVLLAGRGGSGKSTTAVLAAQCGLDFLGDDYVVLDDACGPEVFSVYNSVKFRWDMIERIPKAGSLSMNDPNCDEKGFFYMHETYPDSLIKTLPLQAVLLPKIERRSDTVFKRLAASRGLLGMAASSIFQMPGSGEPTLKRLADILRSTPVYQMSLGTDNQEIARAIKNFLSPGMRS